jgi:hypothetical protein
VDAHSLNAASELFALFPQWRSLARTEKAEDGTEFLIVDVTPPIEANVEYGLTIDTAGGEITVGGGKERSGSVLPKSQRAKGPR